MTHTYSITGMTCNSCVAKVRSELLKLGDVMTAEVQLSAPQATVTMQKHISIVQLQETVSKAGKYVITEIGGDIVSNNATEAVTKDSYFPIFLIFGYIAGVSSLVQFSTGSFDLMQWMAHFMGGFFIVFSFFKILNLQGFADGYRTYDTVARQLPAYGFVYPFIELLLGIAFIAGLAPIVTNMATLLVMGISTVGVAQSLLKKTVFQCACLGTIIKLPLSKVTVFEDLLMVLMSMTMLVMLL